MPIIDLFALHRLARAAHDFGYYNVAKLLKAASASLIAQDARAAQLPITESGILAEAERLEAMLAQASVSPDVLAALRRTRETLASGGMSLMSDAPPVFVCRHCGHVAFNESPSICPTCGAGALTFEEILPTYYLHPEAPELILSHLRALPDTLDQLLSGLTEAQAAQKVPGQEGEWSLKEAAGHLRDANHLLAYRADLLLTQTEPQLKPQATWAEAAAAARQTASAIAAEFRREREGLCARLAALAAPEWQRAGYHGEFGRVTLLQQATYFSKHEHWHLAQMTRLRKDILSPR
jgi:predicted Zn-ribbon and HTH transcriptional regulator